MTDQYKEFYGNIQDILLGSSEVNETIKLMEELFEAYKPARKIDVIVVSE